jgi:hypothetical protein
LVPFPFSDLSESKGDYVQTKPKSNLIAAAVGCGLPLLGAAFGFGLGCALIQGGGDFGAIADAYRTILWSSCAGFVIGLIIAAILVCNPPPWMGKR